MAQTTVAVQFKTCVAPPVQTSEQARDALLAGDKCTAKIYNWLASLDPSSRGQGAQAWLAELSTRVDQAVTQSAQASQQALAACEAGRYKTQPVPSTGFKVRVSAKGAKGTTTSSSTASATSSAKAAVQKAQLTVNLAAVEPPPDPPPCPPVPSSITHRLSQPVFQPYSLGYVYGQEPAQKVGWTEVYEYGIENPPHPATYYGDIPATQTTPARTIVCYGSEYAMHDVFPQFALLSISHMECVVGRITAGLTKILALPPGLTGETDLPQPNVTASGTANYKLIIEYTDPFRQFSGYADINCELEEVGGQVKTAKPQKQNTAAKAVKDMLATCPGLVDFFFNNPSPWETPPGTYRLYIGLASPPSCNISASASLSQDDPGTTSQASTNWTSAHVEHTLYDNTDPWGHTFEWHVETIDVRITDKLEQWFEIDQTTPNGEIAIERQLWTQVTTKQLGTCTDTYVGYFGSVLFAPGQTVRTDWNRNVNNQPLTIGSSQYTVTDSGGLSAPASSRYQNGASTEPANTQDGSINASAVGGPSHYWNKRRLRWPDWAFAAAK
jgi:hypothetical protein